MICDDIDYINNSLEVLNELDEYFKIFVSYKDLLSDLKYIIL